MPEATFKKIYNRFMELNLADPTARLLLRMILGTACEMRKHPDGRLTLPVNLVKYAALGSAAVMIGQGDYLEIWDPANWSKQEDLFLDMDSNPDRFCHLNIHID